MHAFKVIKPLISPLSYHIIYWKHNVTRAIQVSDMTYYILYVDSLSNRTSTLIFQKTIISERQS